MLEALPDGMLRSIALDRGNEFTNQAEIIAKIPNAQFYFAHSMSLWERETNENINGILRWYVPEGTYKVPFFPQLIEAFNYKLNT